MSFRAENDKVLIELDEGLNLRQIVNKELGRSFIHTDRPNPLFILHFDESSLTSSDFKISAKQLEPHFIEFEGESPQCKFHLSLFIRAELTLWDMELINTGEFIIEGIDMPIVGNIACPQDAHITFPCGAGWHIRVGDMEEGDRFSIPYPVYACMQYIDLYFDDFGLYIAYHDSNALYKELAVGKRATPFIQMSIKGLSLKPGKSYRLPIFCISPHKGDWHNGARIYREWMLSFAHRPEAPNWFKALPGWSWLGIKEQLAEKPDVLFSEIPKYSQAAASLGMPTRQVASYFEDGHDTKYPDFKAGDCAGGEDGLIAAIDEAHTLGLKISLYTNGRIVDPASSLSKLPNWLDWAVQAKEPSQENATDWDREGRVLKETYGDVTFAIMCPGCKEWQDLFLDRLTYLAKRYNADGVFVDQVCAAVAHLCYSDKHLHACPAEAWSHYQDFMRRLRERLKMIKPDFYISTEGVCDIFGQYFDALQTHNDWYIPGIEKQVFKPLPSLFRYTLPHLAMCSGPAYQKYPQLLNIAHVIGAGFDLWNIKPGEENSEYAQRLRKILLWYKEYSDALGRDTVLRTPSTDNEHYYAMAFGGEGRIVITGGWFPWPLDLKVSPPTNIRITLTEDLAEPLRSAYFESLKYPRTDIDLVKEGDAIQLNIPFDDACVIVLY